MIWNCDYTHGIFVSWYSCPMCGYDTRNVQYVKGADNEPTDT